MLSISRGARALAALLALLTAAARPVFSQDAGAPSAGDPPRLVMETTDITFTADQGSAPQAAAVEVRNPGGGTAAYDITVRTLSGGAWLSAGPSGVELGAGQSAEVVVTAEPAGVPPGAHAARISVQQNDGGARIDVAVLLVVKGAEPGPGSMATFAGAAWNFAAAGRPAVNAPLGPVFGVAAGPGGVYMADAGNRMVFRLASDGTLHHVAGNGEAGGAGDGGPATAAQLRYPFRLAADQDGNVYIADRDDHRVRRVAPDGGIATVAGTGQAGFSGDGADATGATLNGPRGVAVDGEGNVYIADTGNARIRKVTRDGRIETIAGNGEAGAAAEGTPALDAAIAVEDVAVDASGRVCFTNRYDGTAGLLDADGRIRLLAGASARFSANLSLAIGPDGAWYIADSGNGRVRRLSPSGVVDTVAGSGELAFRGDDGPAGNAALRYPHSVAVDAAGDVWVADTYNMRVRRIGADGTITTAAGNGGFRNAPEPGPAMLATLTGPRGVAVDAAGNLYIADTGGNRIRKVLSDGSLTTAGGTGTYGYFNDGAPAVEAAVVSPRSVAADAWGNLFYCDGNSNSIRRIDADGVIAKVAGTYGEAGFSGDGGPATEARLRGPEGLALDAQGNLYVADSANHRVRRIAPDGVITTVAGNGSAESSGDGGAATEAGLNLPAGVALDTAGNLYIAEFRGERVRVVTTDGLINTYAGDGSRGYGGDGGPAVAASFRDPYGLAVDAAGNLYIADANGARIRMVSPEGVIATVAGSGVPDFSGDGGAATDAALAFPAGVAVDGAGRLFIADSANDRIRVVYPMTPPEPGAAATANRRSR